MRRKIGLQPISYFARFLLPTRHTGAVSLGVEESRIVNKLRTLTICSVEVEVYEASAEECSDLLRDGCVADGTFSSENSSIVLRAGQSPSQRRDSFLHEVGHAFLYLSGLGHLLEASLPKSAKYAEFEELLVRLATPHLVDLISKWEVE